MTVVGGPPEEPADEALEFVSDDPAEVEGHDAAAAIEVAEEEAALEEAAAVPDAEEGEPTA